MFWCAEDCTGKWKNENFVVWTSAGHDIKEMTGTKSQCEDACCDNGLCVGFTRSKFSPDSIWASCWLKRDAPHEDRTHGNWKYHIFMKQ